MYSVHTNNVFFFFISTCLLKSTKFLKRNEKLQRAMQISEWICAERNDGFVIR